MSADGLTLVDEEVAGHAESPLWSPAENALYWVDTVPGTIYRHDMSSGRRVSWRTPTRLGAIGLRRGGLIAAIKTGIGFLDTASGTFTHVVDPEADRPETRINDAKVDRGGRFWFGYQEDAARTQIGTLYRIDPDRSVTAIDRGFTNPNGFAWSLDNRTMYVTDTFIRRIYAYDFDPATGNAANRRIFVEIGPGEGTPDGTTVDSAGYVWSARGNYGARLARYAPDGSLDRTIPLPMTHVTNMAFGGRDLRTLYITSATRNLDAEQLAAQPLAGKIVSLRVDVPGVPEPLFGG
jgi:sugar lactone lactonase YvrE